MTKRKMIHEIGCTILGALGTCSFILALLLAGGAW